LRPILLDKSYDVPYTGDGSKLSSIPIDLIGMSNGIMELQNYVFGS
jgi:hypothetical protein